MQTVVILGGSGLIGSAISKFLSQRGYTVYILSRKPGDTQTFLYKNLLDQNVLDLISRSNIVINLAGESISQRWTQQAKQKIYDSRVKTTALLIEAFKKADKKPALLINASGTGFYGDQGDRLVDESIEAGDDFLGRTAKDWELTAMQAVDLGMRVVTPRFGVVLAPRGGFLSSLLLPFKYFAGAVLGSGKNYLAWIHINDLCKIISFLIENKTIDGPVNAVSPQAVTLKDFCKTLAKILHRPCFFYFPDFLIKAVLGEMSLLILGSCKAFPEKLMVNGFAFDYSDLEKSLRALLR